MAFIAVNFHSSFYHTITFLHLFVVNKKRQLFSCHLFVNLFFDTLPHLLQFLFFSSLGSSLISSMPSNHVSNGFLSSLLFCLPLRFFIVYVNRLQKEIIVHAISSGQKVVMKRQDGSMYWTMTPLLTKTFLPHIHTHGYDTTATVDLLLVRILFTTILLKQHIYTPLVVVCDSKGLHKENEICIFIASVVSECDMNVFLECV